ncbi:hypothetical protein DM02DRAFT_665013 [Periconia macrospinosa]|uniref:Uncharacterized protein n=1 Tax=Periconia macrospinosa TaxID=97972 RepID=A0A2V1CXN8_9PLEO|nr:hypothetical protein DM02DRAFT_665013 [Periconia macrospinosa]
MSKRGRKMGRPLSSRNSTPAIEVGPQNTPANTPAPESLRAADSQSSLAERLEGIRSNRVSPSLRGGSEELGERPPQTDTSELPVNHDLTPNATPLVTVVEVAEHATASESTPHHSQSNDGSPANPRSPAPQEDHGWTEQRPSSDGGHIDVEQHQLPQPALQGASAKFPSFLGSLYTSTNSS